MSMGIIYSLSLNLWNWFRFLIQKTFIEQIYGADIVVTKQLICIHRLWNTIIYIFGDLHVHDDVIEWNNFRVIGSLCAEFTSDRWIPLTKASDAELWCFLWAAPQQTVEWTIETPVICHAIALIMTSLRWNCHVRFCTAETRHITFLCIKNTDNISNCTEKRKICPTFREIMVEVKRSISFVILAIMLA